MIGTSSSVQEQSPNVQPSVQKISVQQHASPAWDPLTISAKVVLLD